MQVQPIVNVAVGLQGVAILGRAVELVPKVGKRKKISARKSTLKLIRGFTDIAVGTALIRPTANLAAGL